MDSLCCIGRRLSARRKFLKLPYPSSCCLGNGPKTCLGTERCGHAVHSARPTCSRLLGIGTLQLGLFWPAVVVHVGDGSADGSVSAQGRRGGGRACGLWWRNWRNSLRSAGWIPTRPRVWVRPRLHAG